MKETHCLNPSCKKELVHTEGRRPKKYCSDKCRISHHLSKKKVPKYVQIETHNKVKQQLDELLKFKTTQPINPKSRVNSGLVVEFTPTTEQSFDGKKLADNIKDEPPMYAEPSEENKIKLNRIADLEKELKNPPKNPSIGLKTWTKVRQDEINKLKNEILNPPI